ncbi:pfs domain-containing protein [Colletotrichum filicis]|nr:pfs domain-containing protein [Colletotrichum filicis]
MDSTHRQDLALRQGPHTILNGNTTDTSEPSCDYNAYTIGWIVALHNELTAAMAMLDEECQQPKNFVQNSTDMNCYSWGRIGAHYVVIASIGEGSYGIAAATRTAASMVHSLPHIRFGLMVGIGAGVPRWEPGYELVDIRLGDVVVSQPVHKSGGVEQYDLVKLKADGQVEPIGHLASPPAALLNGLTKLKATQRRTGSKLPRILAAALENSPLLADRGENDGDAAFIHQGLQNDRLFASTSTHVENAKAQAQPLLLPDQHREDTIEYSDCALCDPQQEIKRPYRKDTNPRIHYGIIASGNSLVKDSVSRDQILQNIGTQCLCFEMEAAGLMNHFPCLVIRGICDYADSHKKDRWQNYAAMVAAAYAKELLSVMDVRNVEQSERVDEILGIVSQIQTNTRDTNQMFHAMSASNRSRDIRSLLSPPEPSIDHNTACGLHHGDTGKWFLEGPEYLDWKAKPHSSLWLHSRPGCGKTILSSTIIEDLQSNVAVSLYFYFTFNDKNKQSLDQAIRSLIIQLYHQNKDAKEYLDSIFEQRVSSTQPTTDRLCSWFTDMAKKAGEVWIVLDALDERDVAHEYQHGQALKGKGILPWIKALLKSEVINFHVLVTSRPEDDILHALGDSIPKGMQIPLRNKSINADIREFIESTIRNWGGPRGWQTSEALLKEVINHLIRKADGM